VTLEANPTNLSRESLQAWKELGCTRLSVGVQSFDAAGLRFLTRDHDPQALAATLGLLPEFFSDYNLDLIYSWPGQSLASWKEDLRQIVALEPTHLSLYNLTYAPKTPIGRAHERNKLQAPPDDTQAEFYLVAQGYLADKGYLQEEVSNWHRPGFPARHNSLYWQDEPYIGVGSGACGYLPSTLESPWGLRYQYPAGLQCFPTMGLPPFEEGRDAEAWLLEYVGASLRSCYGVDLEKVREKTGRTWKPTPWVQESLSTGLMSLDEGAQRLYLSPPEWFRETAWCHEVLGCLR
jgi:oxygen-independent coproporphyrinogen-3 oxidase